MAVQAQYPSNVLLLNNNNNRSIVQEGKNQLGNDYSLQPQPGGEFLHQPHMLFNTIGGSGVGTNSRKRGREVTLTTTPAAPMNSLISSMPQHRPQPPQLIDLTQLHNNPTPQPNVVSTGLRLAFGEQQQHQQVQHHQHHQQQQQSQQHSLSPQSSIVLSLLSEDLATQIKHQKDEIELFIQAQGEQLRRTLAEKRQRHYRALIGTAEEAVARRLREREAEAERAARRNAELEARAAQLGAEAQAWRERARAHEAQAAALQAQLQQAIMGVGCGGGQAEREEGSAEDAESAYIDPERVEASVGPACRACGKRVASVVLLPCRHLCVCGECDAVVQACPLCLSFRSSSVEVFLS
ncbi:hypothetical protein RJ640_023831 [Escallonia rubra]|uniref:RING-type domain-containing protein n=1 Tax=Escallonia rubra TaxID=112253 RepID=A0AA88RTG8_9ASTE|nr:hypothetical protein RJ640_023831 [Escallonia rubra]